MFKNSKEKIKIINKPSIIYWPLILKYLQTVYRKNHPILSKKFFFWLFCEKKIFSIYILIHKKKIMSLMGYKTLKFYASNRQKNSIWLTFFSSSNVGYGLALFRKINSLKKNIFTLNTNKSGSLFYQKHGWSYSLINRNIIIFDLKKINKLKIANIKLSELKKLEFNKKSLLDKFRLNSFTIKNHVPKNIFFKENNRVIKNLDYIKWRYINHPIFKYNLFYEGKFNKKDLAFVVIRKENYFGFQKGKVCRLVDMFFYNNFKSKKNAIKLLKNVFSYLKSNNFEFIDFYCNNKKYSKLFNSFNISKKGYKKNFLISRMTPLLKENFKMNFYFKTLYQSKNAINVMKSDIDGDVPEFI